MWFGCWTTNIELKALQHGLFKGTSLLVQCSKLQRTGSRIAYWREVSKWSESDSAVIQSAATS